MKKFRCYICGKVTKEDHEIDFVVCSKCSGIKKTTIYMEPIKVCRKCGEETGNDKEICSYCNWKEK